MSDKPAQTMSEKAKAKGATKAAAAPSDEPTNDAVGAEGTEATAGELAAIARAEKAEGLLKGLRGALEKAGYTLDDIDDTGVVTVVVVAMEKYDDMARQIEGLGQFLLGREGFAPEPDEGAVKAAIRILSEQHRELEQRRKDEETLVAHLDNFFTFDPIEGERPLHTAIRLLGEQGDDKLVAARVAELEQRLADRGVELDNVRATLREAEAKAEAADRRADKADRAKLAAQRPKPKSNANRKAGAMKIGEDERKAIDAIFEAGDQELELVFSDGKREIAELEPIGVYPAAFRRARAGKQMLNDALELRASRDGLHIAGVALFDGGGNQLSWCPLIEPVTMTAGQIRKLDNLVF